MKKLIGVAASTIALALVASSCGGSASAANNAELCDPNVDLLNNRTVLVQGPLAGLDVDIDNKATKRLQKEAAEDSTYLCDGTVFTLRDGEELMAVLTIQRLSSDARTDDREFRRKIVNDIGGTTPQPVRIGDALVYKTQISDQLFAIWFYERFLYILTVREDQAFAGAVDADELITEVAELKPVDAG